MVDRKCWSASRHIHIGTCFDAWGDPFKCCVCEPADAPEYMNTVEIYAGASIDNVSNANIKTYQNGALIDTYYAESSSWTYMYLSWISNGSTGTMRFDLCSGSTVIDSRSTEWIAPCTEGATKTETCPDGSTIITHECVQGVWYASDRKCPEEPPCVHGDEKTETCEDGSKVVTHQCIPPDFVATGDTCESCVRLAAKRTKLCPDGTTIATHDCVDGEWVATGAECGEGCIDGATKTKTCADGTTIITHECVQGVWYASDRKCPEDPEPEETKASGTSSTIYIIAAVIVLYLMLRG